MKLEMHLAQKQLLVVTGKGGTGKSVMAAALGRRLAARGRRILLLEVDPRENLHNLLNVPPSGGEIVAVGDNLFLQNLKPEAVVDWVLERQVKIGMIVKRIRASPIYRRFVEGAPGLEEIAVIGHALRVVRGDRTDMPEIDTVILDAPATGHGVYLLTAARLFSEAIGQGPFAELAEEVADFVDDPEKTGLVIVTLAEEMPVQEALELRTSLHEKLGRDPELLIMNALYPPVDDAAEMSGDDPLRDLWHDRRKVNEKELARIAERWEGPRLEIPLLPIDEGPALVAKLVEHLGEGLAAMPAVAGEEA